MKSNLFLYCCISLVFLFSFKSHTLGQEKINLSVGFGILEFANVGVRFQIKQSQIGFSVGTYLWSNDPIFSFLADLHLHFGDLSKLSDRKPWYMRFGLVYVYPILHKKDLYLNIRIGREFNLSKKVGLYVDLGGNIEMTKKIKENFPKETGPTGGPQEYPFIPAIGVGIFFKL